MILATYLLHEQVFNRRTNPVCNDEKWTFFIAIAE